MSDTITREERQQWRERLTSKFSCFDADLGSFTLRLLDALEAAEAERKKDIAHCKFEFDRAEQAEAEVARLNKMVDWLAQHGTCPNNGLSYDNFKCDGTIPCRECMKEAARKAVGGEGKENADCPA